MTTLSSFGLKHTFTQCSTFLRSRVTRVRGQGDKIVTQVEISRPFILCVNNQDREPDLLSIREYAPLGHHAGQDSASRPSRSFQGE